MYFVVYAKDKPDSLALRKKIRPDHQAYLRNAPQAIVVHHGGPLLDAEGENMTGTLLVLEGHSKAEVEAFIAEDPYFLNGLFSNVNVSPWQWGIGRPEEAQ